MKLTRKQMALCATAGITVTQLIDAGFTASQLIEAGITASQLVDAGFTTSQLMRVGFTASQLIEAGFTTSQLMRAGITGPAVPGLYTTINADLASGRRKHDQSNFGDNICGTPMCIAGHIVNIAGEAGWKLKRELGYTASASLIHTATHPEMPAPKFHSYPDEWALAYIAEMAEYEASKATS